MRNRESLEKLVRNVLEGFIGKYEENKANFLEKFKNYPGKAIEWNAESLVEDEFLYSLSNKILDAEDGERSLLEIADIVFKQVQEDILNYNLGGSSGHFHRAFDAAEHKAKQKFYRRLSFYMMDYEELLDNEEVAKNFGLKKVFKSQLDDLMRDIKKENDWWENAKTKRDQAVHDYAGNLLASKVNDLLREAKSYGIELEIS